MKGRPVPFAPYSQKKELKPETFRCEVCGRSFVIPDGVARKTAIQRHLDASPCGPDPVVDEVAS
jgi:hypothetical protein